MFVAVQRITTARWSRGIIRFSEGFVAFLPLALLGLIVMVVFGKSHVYPWWTQLPSLQHEKQVYLAHSVLRAARRSACSALITALAALVCLDVGASRRRHLAGGRREVGGRPPRENARRLRRGAPRTAQHAFAAGQARGVHDDHLRLRLVGARVGPVDVARSAFLQHDVRLAGVHGRLARARSWCSRCCVRFWKKYLGARTT